MSRKNPGAESDAAHLLPIMERDYKERLKQATDLVRRYFWCQSRVEGRHIDDDAMKFLDANGGRDFK